MNQNRLSAPMISKSLSDYYYNDEIKLRDLQASSSMSRSLKALNKYVKKNMFYDESEDENDSDYFSKETSPNDSVSTVKSELESVTSDALIKVDNTLIPLTIQRGSITENDHTTLTDDYKFNKLLQSTNKTTPVEPPPEINPEVQKTDPPVPLKRHSIPNPSDLSETSKEKYDLQVTLRTKNHNTSIDNRHSVHDPTDWVNRNEIYPDVYAPLPYKK